MPDLSTLLAAVAPRSRTDQYMVLATLHSLDAATRPVTTAEIAKALRLHVGASKLPTNLSACLRKYSRYVRAAEAGPPLRWCLTSAGTALLAEQSGLELGKAPASDEHLVDVGLVCALEQPEFAAVMRVLGGPDNWKEIGDGRFPHVYRGAHLDTLRGARLSIVGTTSTSMGLTAASIVTTQLVMQYRPKLVVMIGIAAGTRDGGKEFGDVLIADPSVDYNSGKVVRLNGIRGFLPDPYPIGLNPRLRSLLQKYKGDHELFRSIRNEWSGTLPGVANRLHLGPVGAADQVIDDPARVFEIQQNWRKLIGVEMETYGVYRACHESPDPKPRALSVKSVCDFAAEKTDSWQGYAAFTAAEFTFRFLKAEWESLWPTKSTEAS